MTDQHLKVEFACEMSCDSCKSKIGNVLNDISGVRVVDIDVPSQRVLLELSKTDKTVNELQSLIETKTGIRTVVKGLGAEIAAVSEIHGENNLMGVVRMAQLLGKTCLVDGVVDGLPANRRGLSVNIHKFGDMSGNAYENIGPVFVPISTSLPETSTNRASFKVELNNCDLSACIGRAMAIQDEAARKVLGAGIVARASPVGRNVKKICACSGKTLWEERENISATSAAEDMLAFSEGDFVGVAGDSDSYFDKLLKSKWTGVQNSDVFRYIVTEDSLETKIIPGDYKFVAQLNPERGTLRRKPQESFSLKMPFNPNGFNFTKIKKEELLFKFNFSPLSASVIINNSPIEFCNSLMVPALKNCQPQVLTRESLKLALCMVALSGQKSFRMGFNSLGAAASVNHLHWHMYYLKSDLIVEEAPVTNGVLEDWPSKGFAFDLATLSIDSIDAVVDKTFRIIDYCFEIELPHNLFITRRRNGDVIRLIIWTREAEFGVKNDLELNAAFCEFSGYFICKTRETFDTLTEEQCLNLIGTLDTKTSEVSKKL